MTSTLPGPTTTGPATTDPAATGRARPAERPAVRPASRPAERPDDRADDRTPPRGPAPRLPRRALPVVPMAVTEAAALLVATSAAQLAWFGRGPQGLAIGDGGVGYGTVSVALTAAWTLLLLVARADVRPDDLFASGAAAFRDLLRATVVVAVGVSLFSAATQTQISRGWLLVAVPAGLAVLLLNRLAWRAHVRSLRAARRLGTRTVVVGTAAGVAGLRQVLARDSSSGLDVVAEVVLDDLDDAPVAHVARTAELVSLVERRLAAEGAEGVVVVGSGLVGDEFVRRLSWALEGTDVQLIVSPQVGPVSSRRLQPVAVGGHQLIRVDRVQLGGRQSVLKRLMDVALSAVGLVALAPLLAGVAAAIRLTSPGPAVFRQTRVGVDGAEFTLYKFRSMVTGADALVTALVSDDDDARGPLFKMRDDPRVTRVGRVIRRFSVDELPQLVNVLRGDMSLVGPRPPLPREVAAYDRTAHRRLLTRPGLTGAWQVSGRADLDWEEGLVIDLLYVENWTLSGDLAILGRTVGAVLRARGAY